MCVLPGTFKLMVVNVAVPLVNVVLLKPAVAMEAPPSLKVTVPVGVPEPGKLAATTAVNVTAWP